MSARRPIARSRRLMRFALATGAALVALHLATAAAQPFVENFDAGLPESWLVINHSDKVGATSWFRGNTNVFTAQSGAPASYVAANFNATNDAGTISDWLVTPLLPSLQNGQTLTFWTRTEAPATVADRLQVRVCQAGFSGCDSIGETADDVGNYTTLLLDINPDLAPGGYPSTWTKYAIALSGLPGDSQAGRIAFRYFVANGGPGGANSNYIGLDSLDLTFSLPDLIVSTTHLGNLYFGQRSAQFSITVTNIGKGASTGGVAIVDSISSGLTPLSIGGTGWTCDIATLICTRGDPLGSGKSYPPIVLTVDIEHDAPATVTSSVTLTTNGDASAGIKTANDQVVVNAGPVDMPIPALADGALVLLAVLLGVFGALAISRRR